MEGCKSDAKKSRRNCTLDASFLLSNYIFILPLIEYTNSGFETWQ
jgi:hypothetical protein